MFLGAGSITILTALPLALVSMGEEEPAAVSSLLSTIDWILSIAAIGILSGIAARWFLQPGRYSLANAPRRRNELREDGVALAVAVYLIAAVVLSSLTGWVTGQTESVVATLVVGNGAQLAGIGICLLVAARKFRGGMSGFCLGDPESAPSSPVAVAGVVSIMAVGLCPLIRDATMTIILYFAPDYSFASHTTIQALLDGTQPFWVMVALWVGAAVVAPIAEEFFFRGLLQTFFGNLCKRRWLAVVLASLAFGLVHFPQAHAIVALFVLALLIGYAYERTGSLMVAVAIHAAFNLKTLVWVALGSESA